MAAAMRVVCYYKTDVESIKVMNDMLIHCIKGWHVITFVNRLGIETPYVSLIIDPSQLHLLCRLPCTLHKGLLAVNRST